MIITLREAKDEDYHEIMRLYKDFVGENIYSKYDNDSYFEFLKDPQSYMYLAEADGKIIGFATFTTRLVVRFPKHIMQLEELFVSEEYRKHGVGARLIEIMEEKARDLDCMHIYIESRKNKTVAHKFYEDLGYENGGFYFKKTL